MNTMFKMKMKYLQILKSISQVTQVFQKQKNGNLELLVTFKGHLFAKNAFMQNLYLRGNQLLLSMTDLSDFHFLQAM